MTMTTSSMPINTQKLTGIDPKRVVNKEYLNSLGDFYKCSICFKVMVNPTDCEKCGHSYCNECISRLKCPYNCESKTLKPSSMGIKDILSNLFFYCENDKCDLKISYSNVQSHDLSCEYQKITCPSTGCNLQLPRKDLERHIKDECVYSLLTCKYCGYDFVRSKIEEHESACLSIYSALNGDGSVDIANMNIDPKKYLQALSLNISKLVKENRTRSKIEDEKDKDKEYKNAEAIVSIFESILEKKNIAGGSIAGNDGNNTINNISNGFSNLNTQLISSELKEEMNKKMGFFEKNLEGLNYTLEELKKMIIERSESDKAIKNKEEKEEEEEKAIKEKEKEEAKQNNKRIMATLLEKVLNETEAKLNNTITLLSTHIKSQIEYSEKMNNKIDSIQTEISQSQNTQKELKEIISQPQSLFQSLPQMETQIQLQPQIEIKEIEKVITVLPDVNFNDYFNKIIQLIEQTSSLIVNYHQQLSNEIHAIGITIDHLKLTLIPMPIKIEKEDQAIINLKTFDELIASKEEEMIQDKGKDDKEDNQIEQTQIKSKPIKETESQADKEEISIKEDTDEKQEEEIKRKEKEKEKEKAKEKLIKEEKRLENISNIIKTEIKEFNTEIKTYITNEIDEKIKAITNIVDGMNTEIISLNKKIKEIKGMICEEFEDISQLINDNNKKSEEKETEIMKTLEEKINQTKPIEIVKEETLLKDKIDHHMHKLTENSIYHCIEFNIEKQINVISQKDSPKVKDTLPQVKSQSIEISSGLSNEISTIIKQTILPAITNKLNEVSINELKTVIISEFDAKLERLETNIEENIDGRLKAMFSLKWCSECEKVDYFYGFIKCSICLNESCKQCVMLCISCKHLVCKNCALCPKCGKPYCQTCRIACQSCDPPRKYCESCIQTCSFCKKQVCTMCIRQCITCKKYTCKECSKTCKICEKHSCFKCDTSKNFRTCFKCGQTACKDCIRQCTFCESETCQKCFAICNSCKKFSCTKCSHPCHSCEEEFCPVCSKDFSKCGKCNKEFCINCIKCLRRCKKCSKNTCKECCNQCKKCKNIFCLDCSIGCDNCNGYMCSNCTYRCVCDMVVFCEKCLNDINPIGPHDCVFYGNDSSCFKGIKSKSKIKLPNDFEAKFFLEKYTVEANLLIGLTDNNRFDEDSVTFIDNVWAFKVRTGEKYSSVKSLEPFYNKECREGYFIQIAKKNDYLFFRVNSEDMPPAYSLPKKDYWIYIENDAPINTAHVRLVYIRKI